MFNYRERPRCVLAVTMRVRRRRLVHRMLLRTLNDRLLLQVRRVVRGLHRTRARALSRLRPPTRARRRPLLHGDVSRR